MSSDLLTVAGWFRSNALAVNGDKCLSMWLGSTTKHPSYYFDNREISSIDAMKLLDVVIDRELNSNDHVPAIVRKLSNQLQVIKQHKS